MKRNDAICPACDSPQFLELCTLAEMPVFIGIQWASAVEAKSCPKGDLNLAFCSDCGFIWNQAFDPKKLEYSQQYDNALDYSKVFQDYAHTLVTRLVETYDIRNKNVIEIGCNKGRFLAIICETNKNHGTGFNPSYEGEHWPSPAANHITYVRNLYSEKHASRRADLICCRFVFEHIPRPLDFLKLVRRAIGSQAETVVYFEVPNVRLILDTPSPWDVIYEHCSYFGIESLYRVFDAAGFDILRLEETYAGQFLGIDARPRSENMSGLVGRWGDLPGLENSVEKFRSGLHNLFDHWMKRIDDWSANCKRTVAWGAGAKAVSFFNLLQINDAIPYVVDINPHKQGLHLAGTGQRIVAPEFLTTYQPDIVILLNPIYRREVADQLHELGVSAELVDAF